MPKYKLRRLWVFLLIPISLIMTIIARKNPQMVEDSYSRLIYPVISSAISILTGFANFSIAELLIVFAVAFAIFYLILFFLRLSRMQKEKRGYQIYLLVVNIGVLLVVISFLFTLLCGLNYYRVSLTDSMKLDVEAVTNEELYELGLSLVEDANTYRELVATDENGVMKLSESLENSLLQSQRIMNHLPLDSQFSYLSGLYAQPKQIRFSGVLSAFGVEGFFFPYTYEANINVDLPDHMLPTAMLHEQVHVRGYMREDETNFIAYYCGIESGDPDFQYSATMMLLRYTLSLLHQKGDARYEDLIAQMSPLVRADFEEGSAYISAHQGIFSTIGQGVAHLFFRSTAQKDGVDSYQNVARLVASYRAGKGLSGT